MWTKEVAKIWTHYVPPCRPSRFELEICSKIISAKRVEDSERAKILILGSTTEFRELCYEESCDVTIIDNSLEYHREISKELKYRSIKENLRILNWQDMDYINEFDVVLGDLVIGNLKDKDVDYFLSLVQKSLKPSGHFLNKSFFYDASKEIIAPEIFFKNYEDSFSRFDPFPYTVYNLTTFCMNKNDYSLSFYGMYMEVKRCFENGIISKRTYDRFLEFGWQNDFKTEFYVMPKNLWETTIQKYFSSFITNYGPYHWSNDFPFYTLKN